MTLTTSSGTLSIVPLSYKGTFAAAATTDFTTLPNKEKIYIFQFWGAGSIRLRNNAGVDFCPAVQAVLTSGVIVVTWDATNSQWYCYEVSDTGPGATNSQGGKQADDGGFKIVTTGATAGICYCINIS